MSSGDLLIFLLLFGYVCVPASSQPEGKTSDFITQTVYGFLDFTTTIGKTVMIFSPQSAPSLDLSPVAKTTANIIQTKPYSEPAKLSEIHPTKLSLNEGVNIKSSIKATPPAQKDYINKPDYDLLSRQPENYAEESYHVVDLVSRKKSAIKKPPTPKLPHPVGLVTTLSGRVAKDGTTTIHETSVIGTYISGKYAQVLQSNSHVLNNNQLAITPSPSAHILRTESPSLHSLKPVGRFKNRISVEDNRSTSPTPESTTHRSRKHSSNSGKHKTKSHSKSKSKTGRSSRRNNDNTSTTTPTTHESKRYSYRQRPQTTTPTSSTVISSTAGKVRPSGRWQYKTTMKPRVYIRKPTDYLSSTQPSTHVSSSTISESDVSSTTSSILDVFTPSPNARIDKSIDNITIENQIGSQELYPVETLAVDIVTPSNLDDIYYEVATIKSPYVFQVGSVKKTRYVTVTSTTEKSFETDYADKSSIKGPLIENILAPSTQINQILQASSISTFPACTLSDVTETPSLDEFIETYTQSHIKLKTQVFPVVPVNQSTSYLTLIQTYAVTSHITATKTIPACFSNNLFEFNSKLDESGSELHLELEFGDAANLEPDITTTTTLSDVVSSTVMPNNDALKKTQSDEELSKYYPHLSPEHLQQLAYLKLLQQNGQVSPMPSPTPVIPTPQPLPSLNPFALPQPQYAVVTSQTVQPTTLTQTLSRILKLTFGARTALTTIFSTNVVSTEVPTVITTSVPIQPTASFPNFFAPAFPQFPFIG